MKEYELLCVLSDVSDGADPGHLRLVSQGSLTAAFLPEPRPVISLPLSRRTALQDAAHRQAMLEKLAAQGTVIVAKPRQWLTENDAVTLLQVNQAILAQTAKSLRGKAQFQITVTWDTAQVLDQFRFSSELSGVFRKGQITTAELEAAISKLRTRLSSQIEAILTTCAPTQIALPRAEGMLLNCVALLDRAAECTLDDCVAQIDAIWTEGFHIKQIGPAPAGSFALLDLAWVGSAEIDRAYATLDLEKYVSANAVKAARQRALAKSPQKADVVRRAADIISRAAPLTSSGFYFASLLSEETSHFNTSAMEVA